jgi:hypothetical protein
MPIPYGWSDYGFLVAGAIDDPASVAHHVVSGRLPQALAVDLLPRLLRAGPRYCEAGSPETVVSLAAAHHAPDSARQVLYVSERANSAPAAASIELNNCEERLTIRSVRSPLDLPVQELRASNLLTIKLGRLGKTTDPTARAWRLHRTSRLAPQPGGHWTPRLQGEPQCRRVSM